MRRLFFALLVVVCTASVSEAQWTYSYGSRGRYAQSYTYPSGQSTTWTNRGGYYNSYTPGYYGGYNYPTYGAPVYQGYYVPTQYNPRGWYGAMGNWGD